MEINIYILHVTQLWLLYVVAQNVNADTNSYIHAQCSFVDIRYVFEQYKYQSIYH